MDHPGSQTRVSAFRNFLRQGKARGIALIVSAAVALTWSNSAGGESYRALLHKMLGPYDIQFWINDGLMATFFLLVGLELRREMSDGELALPGRLATPATGALGGMVVPALIFSAFNYQDGTAMRGWAVPVATDIAFALAVLNVLGQRVPVALVVFVTALAVIDDVGAVVVIAVFYSYPIDLAALARAVGILALLGLINRAGVRALWVYLLGGLWLWAVLARSGIHATLSGVALAFVVPSQNRHDDQLGPALRLQRGLEPLVAYIVLPLFGLANAGLGFDALPKNAFLEPLTLGVATALFFGKPIGVFGSIWIAERLKIATLPSKVTRLQLYGASILCGIGFTMSLLISGLAFTGSPLAGEVKLAIFGSSLMSACSGLVVLALCTRREPRR